MNPRTRKLYTVMAMRHSGTHLILPIVKQITGKALYRPKGEEALICEPSGPVIVFLRDPRNRLISAWRWKRGSLPSDRQMAKFMVTQKDGDARSPMSFMLRWAQRWAGFEGALQVRFESIASEGVREVARIAAFLGKDIDASAIYSRNWRQGTFTGQHSDWRECFGPLSLEAWNENGGPKLLKTMGYE